MVEVAKMAALTPVHDSKVPGLVRPVDVHEEIPGPFQCLPVESMSTRNVQIVRETKSHTGASTVVP